MASYSLNQIGRDMKEQHLLESSSWVMNKCTENCFISLKENQLLPTEERCVYNCIVKSIDFNDYFDKKLQYAVRNLD